MDARAAERIHTHADFGVMNRAHIEYNAEVVHVSTEKIIAVGGARAQRPGVILVAARARRKLGATIPRKFIGVSFDREPIASLIARPIVARVRDYTTNLGTRLDDGAGLWLTGSVGTGKTSLAMLVSKHAIEAGRSVAIFSLPSLLARIRATFDDDDKGALSQLSLIERLTTVDLLHVDDVGAEKTTEWVLEQWYEIVNKRYEHGRAIIITTNLDQAAMVAQIGERTTSRLEEMCEILPLNGPDARRQRPGTGLRVA